MISTLEWEENPTVSLLVFRVIFVPIEWTGAQWFKVRFEVLDFECEGSLKSGGVIFFANVRWFLVVDHNRLWERLRAERFAVLKDGLQKLTSFRHFFLFIALINFGIIACKIEATNSEAERTEKQMINGEKIGIIFELKA